MALFIVRMNLSKRRTPGKVLRSTIISPDERNEKRKRESEEKDG